MDIRSLLFQKGEDGYPQCLWDKMSVDINPAVAEY